MKKNLLIILILMISGITQAQFNSEKSSYDFSTVITADSVGYSVSNVRSITFVNKGDQNIMIDSLYILEPSEYLILGGQKQTYVTDTFNLYFTGSGTKKLNIIKETITYW